MDKIKLFNFRSAFSCQANRDCGFLNICNEANLCAHQDLTFGLVEIISYVLISIIVGLANVGGLGGGIIKVPILVIILNFSVKEATFLSYPILLGGVLSNVILLIFQRHPKKDKPIIDFDLALILVPTILLGTVLGVLMNIIISEIILSSVFIVFLFIVCLYLFMKARDMKQKQQEDKEEQDSMPQNKNNSNNEQNENKLSKSTILLVKQNSYMSETDQKKIEQIDEYCQKEYGIEYYEVVSQDSQEQSSGEDSKSNPNKQKQDNKIENKQLAEFMDQEKKMIPLNKLFYLILMFLVFTFIGISKGGKGFQSIFGIQKCDDLYFLLTALQLVSSIVFMSLIYLQQKRLHEYKIQIKYQFDREDFQFSNHRFFILCLTGLAAGSVTGMLGMGAGLIILPVLLSLGCHTRVCSSTSGFMYLFIGGTSIIYVITEGVLSYKMILFYALLALIGGLLFSNILYFYVNKYNLQSLIIWIILFVALLNLVSMPYYIYAKSNQYGWDSLMKNQSFCD
ncbi:hypothetical protein ABPG72_020399 [Tetrahymena utriculariae]